MMDVGPATPTIHPKEALPMYPKRQWKARFTPSEFCRGWVFFALYLLVFPLLMGWLQMQIGRASCRERV